MTPIIDRTQIHPEAALPGDPNLDCDIVGILVTSVVTIGEERELLVRLEGGAGRMVDVATGELVTVDHVATFDAFARFPGAPIDFWKAMVDQLERWRQGGTPLWFGAVPGKVSTLIKDQEHYVFLPRRKDPDGC